MRKATLAGALALAVITPSLASAGARHIHPQRRAASVPSDATARQIASFKAALRLRPDQERHWPPVADALRHLMRAKASVPIDGFGQTSSGAVDPERLRQLAMAAGPLVRSMDSEQKFTAINLVNAMGYGAILAAF